jgi:hypothetical protein
VYPLGLYRPGRQPGRATCVCRHVKASAGARRVPSAARDDGFGGEGDARQAVTALYQAHVLGLISGNEFSPLSTSPDSVSPYENAF